MRFVLTPPPPPPNTHTHTHTQPHSVTTKTILDLYSTHSSTSIPNTRQLSNNHKPNHTRLYHHCPTSDTMELLSLPDIRHSGLCCHCLTSETVLYCHCQTSDTMDFTVTARHQTQWTLLSLPDIRHSVLYCHCQTSNTLDFIVTARHQTLDFTTTA